MSEVPDGVKQLLFMCENMPPWLRVDELPNQIGKTVAVYAPIVVIGNFQG